jgi:preprotein translocase subunit SecE
MEVEFGIKSLIKQMILVLALTFFLSLIITVMVG